MMGEYLMFPGLGFDAWLDHRSLHFKGWVILRVTRCGSEADQLPVVQASMTRCQSL